MDHLLEILAVARFVEAVAQRVEHMALDTVADGHRDRRTGVGDLHAPDQTVGGLHGDGAHQAFAEVLRHLQCQRLGHHRVGDLGVQGVEEFRDRATGKLNVDDGTSDAHNPPDGGVALPAGFGLFCGCGHISSLLFATRGFWWVLLWLGLFRIGQRVGTADDLADFLGDLRLALPVGLQREGLDQVVGVIGGRLHRAPA